MSLFSFVRRRVVHERHADPCVKGMCLRIGYLARTLEGAMGACAFWPTTTSSSSSFLLLSLFVIVRGEHGYPHAICPTHCSFFLCPHHATKRIHKYTTQDTQTQEDPCCLSLCLLFFFPPLIAFTPHAGHPRNEQSSCEQPTPMQSSCVLHPHSNKHHTHTIHTGQSSTIKLPFLSSLHVLRGKPERVVEAFRSQCELRQHIEGRPFCTPV